MSNVNAREGCPLIENPQPVPGSEPGLQPPPYSSLFSSRSQEYNPVQVVPTAPMDPRYPMPTPMPIPLPMANVPLVNQEAAPNQIVDISSQPKETRKRPKRCRCVRMGLVTGVIIFASVLGKGLQRQMQDDNAKKLMRRISEQARATARETKFILDPSQFRPRIPDISDPGWRLQLKSSDPLDSSKNFRIRRSYFNRTRLGNYFRDGTKQMGLQELFPMKRLLRQRGHKHDLPAEEKLDNEWLSRKKRSNKRKKYNRSYYRF